MYVLGVYWFVCYQSGACISDLNELAAHKYLAQRLCTVRCYYHQLIMYGIVGHSWWRDFGFCGQFALARLLIWVALLWYVVLKHSTTEHITNCAIMHHIMT